MCTLEVLVEEHVHALGIKSQIDVNIEKIASQLEEDENTCKEMFGDDYSLYFVGMLLSKAKQWLDKTPHGNRRAFVALLYDDVKPMNPDMFLCLLIASYISHESQRTDPMLLNFVEFDFDKVRRLTSNK